MDFVNETKVSAGWTLGFQPDGRELLIVAVKATFLIRKNGEEASLAEEQVPLTEADKFTGEPGLSAVLYETDYAHRKPVCDVLLNGSAYAPDGKPTERVQVALQVGRMYKSFNVVGDRVWDRFVLNTSSTLPLKFVIKKITYDVAYGGVDSDKKDPSKQKTYLKNPVGVGYYPISEGSDLIGKPLPNTEAIGQPVKTTTGDYQPMSFGPIGRNFLSRFPFAGTYNQKWLDNRAPFWPDDFDYCYFQAAPPEQQIPYPAGGEEVVLHNLTPHGLTRFHLPRMRMPVLFIPYRGEDRQLEAVIDTILIEPDQNRFMLTWRASLPLRRNCFELRQLIVGEMPHEWYRRRRAEDRGKTYYRSLSELIKAKRGS
jgi:hypothetical protein